MMGGMVSGPKFLPYHEVAGCATFREAVVLGWERRRIACMTKGRLSELCGLLPQHVSDYLHPNDLNPKGQRRRSLPAEKIASFEAVVGNRAVTQFLIRQASLHLMEEMIQQQVQAVA